MNHRSLTESQTYDPRFHPKGLTHFNIGYRTDVPGPNEFLVDLETSMVAEYLLKNSRGKTVRVCLTSVYDLAKFIVAAIEHGPGNWPREFTLRGDRLSVEDLVKSCSYVTNTTLEHRVLEYTDIQPLLDYYRQTHDARRVCVMQELLDVADGRYDFSTASLNEVVTRSRSLDVQPMTFLQWFSSIWQAAGPET
ncbi:isoflavone reductase family protein [Sarocladium implicatum]|nr:isoflavone reductase family protein [Sarocladium implicatum]